MREKSIEEKLVAAVKVQGGFVEVKTPGEKPRSLQRLRIKTLRRLGFKAFVLDSPDQIGGIIDEIQTP